MKEIIYVGGFELPDKNAAAQRVLSNAKLLHEMGYKVTFVGISKDMQSAPSEVEGFESCSVPYPVNTKQWIHQICTFINAEFIRERKPDYVILYNFPAIASLRLLKTCHKNGIKVIHDVTEWETNHGWTPSDFVRKIDINLRMRYCMKRMDGVVAISRYLYDSFKDSTSTILVPPTVDLNDGKWRRDRELTTGDKVRLVFAGGAGPHKDRLDYVIDAVSRIDNLELYIIGTTKEQYYSRFGFWPTESDNIKYLGILSHQETISEICKSDFQVIIRNKNTKTTAGFPTKFVESMSCCVPVIANPSSNIGDYLEDGKNGFLVKEISMLRETLDRVAGMEKSDIVRMKENCKLLTEFDYHYYKSEFEKIII